MKVRAVIFDLYWTLLYEEETGLLEQAMALVEQAGANRELWHEAWQHTLEASWRNELSLLGRAQQSLRQAGLGGRDGALAERLAGLMAARSVARLYPDVRESLAQVKEMGYHMGLVSNIASYRRWWLEELDLAPFFDATALSCEVGLMKPQAEIYLAAARRLGVSPRECVFVDDVPSYVAAAKGVGMTGVRINRFDSEEAYAEDEPTEVQPDLSIGHLGELLEWLPPPAAEDAGAGRR